jgi:hypothetical protein
MKSTLRLLPVLALAGAFLPLHADDVTDHLTAAKDAYEDGQVSQAITALDTAAQFLRQKKADLVAQLLPAAPKGWEASEAETEASAASMLGGGVTARRSYTRGDSSVTIKIQSDSPLLQAAMAFNNPALLTLSGAKLETIQGQSVAILFEDGSTSGTLKAVIEGRYNFEIEGENVTADDLRTFANAFPFAKLIKL